jgi:hypothetical protein
MNQFDVVGLPIGKWLSKKRTEIKNGSLPLDQYLALCPFLPTMDRINKPGVRAQNPAKYNRIDTLLNMEPQVWDNFEEKVKDGIVDILPPNGGNNYNLWYGGFDEAKEKQPKYDSFKGGSQKYKHPYTCISISSDSSDSSDGEDEDSKA